MDVRVINTPEEFATVILYNRFPREKIFGKGQKLGELTLRIRRLMDTKQTPEGEKIFYNPDRSIGHKMALYNIPKRMARELLAYRSDRWRLYNSEPLEVQMPGPKGTMRWVTFNPWYFEANQVQVGNDPENDEVKFETKITWYEDVDGVKYYRDKATLEAAKATEIVKAAETVVSALPQKPEEPFVLRWPPGLNVNETIAHIRSVCEEHGIEEKQWKEFEKGERERVGRNNNSYNKAEFPVVVKNYEEFIRKCLK